VKKEYFVCVTPDDTMKIGTYVGTRLKQGDIVLLEGSLGSGKTTFVKGIAASIGIDDEVTSPTFTIISILYRIETHHELDELGLEEYLYGKGIAVIEWGEKIEDHIRDAVVKVVISINEKGERTITITGLNEHRAV
jgi:tRNA threonylcarbamoyladenosine biosynthesis protein TsaE